MSQCSFHSKGNICFSESLNLYTSVIKTPLLSTVYSKNISKINKSILLGSILYYFEELPIYGTDVVA